MQHGKRVGFQSALLVGTGVIAGSFAASLLAWWLAQDALAALLLTVSAVGLISRLWGMYALRRLELSLRAERGALSVGQSLTVHYTLSNNKALPLIWLELCRRVPPRGCLVPEESFSLRRFSEEEAAYTGLKEAYLRRFTFLMGFRSLEWDCVWTAARRGVCRPGGHILRSGDGFGLTQSTEAVEAAGEELLVVWPRIVPVRTELFLRNLWSGRTGRAGWVEDPGVLRGERAYQPGDPWKRIDWRAAARTDELNVRQFETIRPLSLLFLLDAASFADAEDAISLTASLLLALAQSGVSCGLALPGTASAAPLLLRPDDPSVSVESCLFALSDFDAESAGESFDVRGVVSASAEAGQLWLLCESLRDLRCGALYAALAHSGLRCLCREPGGGAALFSDVRGKEAAP